MLKSEFKNQQPEKSYIFEYEPKLQAMFLSILDTDGMYPCYVHDPEAGTYKIIKTKAGKLQMIK